MADKSSEISKNIEKSKSRASKNAENARNQHINEKNKFLVELLNEARDHHQIANICSLKETLDQLKTLSMLLEDCKKQQNHFLGQIEPLIKQKLFVSPEQGCAGTEAAAVIHISDNEDQSIKKERE